MAEVAVILPVFNAEDTLERSLRSMLSQTWRDLAVIVVDDGSTDGSPRVAEQVAGADPRVVLCRHDSNRGICAALDLGLQQAGDARYLARMDADDWSDPDRIRQQVAYLQDHPDIGLVGTRVTYGGDPERQQGYAAYVDWTNALLTPDDIALNRFVESPFAHPSVMFRRDVVAAFGGYRHGPFPEDYELWLRWLDAGVRMAKLPEALVTWYDPPGRLSRTDSRYARRAFYACKATYLARWLEAHNPRYPDIVVWGAGRETRKRAEMLVDAGVTITHYIDVDPNKIGQCIHGRPVWSEDDLPDPGSCFVVSYVGKRGAREGIRSRLRARGYLEGKHFVMGA